MPAPITTTSKLSPACSTSLCWLLGILLLLLLLLHVVLLQLALLAAPHVTVHTVGGCALATPVKLRMLLAWLGADNGSLKGCLIRQGWWSLLCGEGTLARQGQP